MTAPEPPSRGVRRSRSGALLGGVCAGVARSAGLDPLLLRIALVAVTVLTGGAALVVYLAAWVLIPRDAPGAALPPGSDRPGPPLDGVTGAATPAGDSLGPATDVRAAWSTVGHDLRTLATELRRPASDPTATTGPTAAEPVESPDPTAPGGTDTGGADAGAPTPAGGIPAPRSPLTAADDAATALGERLRTPEVQAGARRAAGSVTQALNASVDELGRRLRRDPG